jgi:hypothetical protein
MSVNSFQSSNDYTVPNVYINHIESLAKDSKNPFESETPSPSNKPFIPRLNIFTLKNNENNIIQFKKVIETLKYYSDYIHIKICNETINIQITDIANICIINIIFNKEYFETFKIEYEVIISLNINEMNKIFKTLNKNNIIYFVLKEHNNTLDISSDYNEDIKKNFKINILDLNYEWIDISKFIINKENTLLLNIESKKLQTIFYELNVFSDNIIIKKKKDNDILYFIINDRDSNLYSKYELKNILDNKEVDLCVSLNYLNNFKLLNNFNLIDLKIANDKPLYLKMMDKYINIEYMLAPKINDI